MRRRHVRRLPVVTGTGTLCGIITYGDIRNLDLFQTLKFDVAAIAEALHHTHVSEVMTTWPITVTETTSLVEAGRLMLRNNITGLPVVDTQRHVVGIITARGLLEALITSGSQELPDIGEAYDGRTRERSNTREYGRARDEDTLEGEEERDDSDDHHRR